MYKYFFFDMDGTITESRQKIGKEMQDILSSIPCVVISGASLEKMKRQVGNIGFLMPQNGNELWNGNYLWQDKMKWENKRTIFRHIKRINPNVSSDMVEDRGSQISYSLVGHNAPSDIKKHFDPQGTIRKKLFENLKGVDMKIGGTTCIDYLEKGKNKGYNIRRFLKLYGIKRKDCVYFGDALFPGGNDESVKGVMKTIQVSSPQDTLKKLKKYAKNS